MPWALLLDLRVWLAGLAIGAGIYAAVQRMEKEHCQATFAQFRADVESEAAKAKVAAARREALQATNAQEALDDLQARNSSLAARYSAVERLRHESPGSGPVPSLSDAAKGACPGGGKPGESDASARRMEQVEAGINRVLERGDKEIAKFVELWQLQQKNAKETSVSSVKTLDPATNVAP